MLDSSACRIDQTFYLSHYFAFVFSTLKIQFDAISMDTVNRDTHYACIQLEIYIFLDFYFDT